MKVVVKDFLNVRVGKPSVNAPTFQFLAPGSELEIDGKLYSGDKVEGVDTWVKDGAGNFYWSGGTNFTLNTISTGQIVSWHEKLMIHQIWNDHNERGRFVTVAVLDTGVNASIPDVARAVSVENIIIDRTSYPENALVKNDDSNIGHGTRCLSIIGSRNANCVVGIAPECKLISGKISVNREVRNFDFILKGIRWALEQGAEVISISYAVELTNQEKLMHDANFQNLIRGKKVLIFAAAGNSATTQLTGERYPASFDNCISVGAVNELNALSNITVLSAKTILHALGENVESLGKSSTPDILSGTSFSTPIVAGIAALAISFLKNTKGDWDKAKLQQALFASGLPINGFPSKKSVNATQLFRNLTA